MWLIHNNVLWDLHYSIKYSWIFSTFRDYICTTYIGSILEEEQEEEGGMKRSRKAEEDKNKGQKLFKEFDSVPHSYESVPNKDPSMKEQTQWKSWQLGKER